MASLGSNRVLLLGILLGARTWGLGADVPVGFELLDARGTGIDFTNRVADSRYLTNQIPLNGSGVALGDVDGDGRPDIFLAAYSGGNALYRNQIGRAHV